MGAVKAVTMADGSHPAESAALAPTSQVSTGDDAIAAAIARGDDKRALLLCAREHGPALGRLCMAMVGSQADAEDLAQDVLLEAHRGFSGWTRRGSMRSWLLTIARRKCARWLEKRARRRAKLRLVHSEVPAPDSGQLPDGQLQQRQRAAVARTALGRLKPSQREALLLRYAAQLSFKEVAVACNIEEPTARKRVSRALCALRKSIETAAAASPKKELS